MDMGLTGTAGSDLFFFLEVKLVPIETPPLTTTTTDKGISVWGACNPGTLCSDPKYLREKFL
jgi:hypothetical protein